MTQQRKVQTIRLGGKKHCGGLFLMKVFRKIDCSGRSCSIHAC
uniref:Uncharacterized protein n=1 Tax=Nelumbo nucifera TaxID=4432 RepID=A0A822YUZ3_NELNU|nr:TPA_asm: hypothetical protein HUJ06_005196 [Nelumbo nucifera]